VDCLILQNLGVFCRFAGRLSDRKPSAPTLNFSPGPADISPVSADELVQLEIMLNRFRKLIAELIRGGLGRNAFEPWEIDLLLDFQTCWLDPRRRLKILRAYQKAVEHQLESGPGPPMKLSEFLHRKMTRRPTRS
jgi:hypothetical protein